jgi:hypothetical protein
MAISMNDSNGYKEAQNQYPLGSLAQLWKQRSRPKKKCNSQLYPSIHAPMALAQWF